MVGVPGRSKGCNTCLQRKVKCDQATPFCGNCQKSNRLCTGYKRRLGYVLSRDVRLTDLGERDETTVTHRGRWRKTAVKQPLFTTHQVDEPSLLLTDEAPSLSLCRQVSTNATLLQQFHYVFLNDHFPAEMLGRKRPISGLYMDWLLKLQDDVIQTPALESAVASYFAARVGRKNNDINLVNQSRSMYVAGLERIRQAINSPETRFSDETLAACLALLLYELTERPAEVPSAYMTHLTGAMVLLQERGPDACTSPLGHSLFLQLRAQAIPMALIFRRETFLSRPEWMEKPWKLISKSPITELEDNLMVVADIIKKFDEVSSETDHSVRQEGFRNVVTRYLEVESALGNLYQIFENSISGPLYWSELSTINSRLDNTAEAKVFPVSFYFAAFFNAQFISLYWSGMMAVTNQVMYAYNQLIALESPTLLDSNNDTPLGTIAAIDSELQSREYSKKWKTMAMNICQSTEYFLQDKMGELGGLFIIAQLSGCYSCVRHFPEEFDREISWIDEMIQRIKHRSNVQALMF